MPRRVQRLIGLRGLGVHGFLRAFEDERGERRGQFGCVPEELNCNEYRRDCNIFTF